MRQVFTLWPTEGHAAPQRRIAPDGLPAWASDPGPAAQTLRWTRQDWLFLGLAALPVLTLGLLVADGLHLSLASLLICSFAIGLAAFAISTHRRRISALQGELADARRWNDTLFQRSGISLWREDWSHARDAVEDLMRRGIRDMQSHFAAHPDELRSVRRGVIIKDVNDFAVLRAGAENKQQLLGSLDNLLPDTDQTFVQWLVAFANGDNFYRSETHITMPDGQEVDTLFAAGLPQNRRDFEDILVSDLDVTEYKSTQTRLAQAEQDLARAVRVSTMGALTASIAHEVNSPLAAIVSSSEAALRWLGRDAPDLAEAREAIGNALAAATRARSVVEQTRAFLSNSSTSAAPQDLAAIVRDSVLLIERELRAHGVSVHIDAPDGLPLVTADRVNMQQVMVNLMMNAAQAMKDSTGKRDLTIALRPEGESVRVEIRDKGPGIPPDRLHSVFQPFYSTREGGMGMGLAICKSCIEAHGGRIWASASPDRGAVFHFELPMAPA
ncbi:sensor histidine kinase [Paracoccus ravus]|uniref:sensor histidine kinase n=1 Tax=Paracoccus ravus TaxID=2447760 RepID=UPI0014310D4F|nr:ATP-binding protein [Paracoccus ravus]